jgi:5-amino-6-(5-phosphoribosylamino)uracil reductase
MNKDSKPYVLLKFAVSLDGYIDDGTKNRLILSNEEDFKRVHIERAKCDAVMIGAETIRKDNPSILLKPYELCEKRLKEGKSRYPMKVTVTASGNFDKDLRFFNLGDTKKIIYCTEKAKNTLKNKFEDLVEIVSMGENTINPKLILRDLKKKGVNKLMIEGGSKISTMFLNNNLVDEIQISIAPFFVGDKNAPKFVNEASFPFNKDNRMKLESVEIIGDMTLSTYILK